MQLKEYVQGANYEAKDPRVSDSTAYSFGCDENLETLDQLFCSLDQKRKDIEDIWQNTVEQTHITQQMVTKLVDWMFASFWRFDMEDDCIFLCLGLMQVYFKNRVVQKSNLQALGLVTMLIASKYTQVKKLKITDVLELCQEKYQTDEIVEMEADILNLLSFDLELPCIYKYYQTFIQDQFLSEEEQGKVLFWLQVAQLQGLLSIQDDKILLLDVVDLVQNSDLVPDRLVSLVSFITSTEFRYVVKKHMSCFDIDSYLETLAVQ